MVATRTRRRRPDDDAALREVELSLSSTLRSGGIIARPTAAAGVAADWQASVQLDPPARFHLRRPDLRRTVALRRTGRQASDN